MVSRWRHHSPSHDNINTIDDSYTDKFEAMNLRDRSNEFLSTVKSIEAKQINGVVPSVRAPLQQRSQFMGYAKNIGRDLAKTFEKLEKLTILAKKKSLFDDSSAEIRDLTNIIKQDLNSLNNQIAQLQELSRHQPNSNSKAMSSHTNSVVLALQSKLANMSTEFKSVLEIRTENLKQQRNRREQFSLADSEQQRHRKNANGSSSKYAASAGSILLSDDLNEGASRPGSSSAAGSSDVAINMDVMDRRYQQQMQIIDEQDSYLQERAETMQNIESTIVELGGIFQQLAHMVKEQEEVIQRIDSNVSDTEMNVEAAHGELLKYFQSVTSNRWLMFKVFGVLIIFFILFIVFMV